jgi:hypothetical protein
MSSAVASSEVEHTDPTGQLDPIEVPPELAAYLGSPPPPYLSIPEVGRITRRTVQTVNAWIRQGRLSTIRLNGDARLVPTREIIALFDAGNSKQGRRVPRPNRGIHVNDSSGAEARPDSGAEGQ